MNKIFVVFNFVVGAWTAKKAKLKSTAKISTYIVSYRPSTKPSKCRQPLGHPSLYSSWGSKSSMATVCVWVFTLGYNYTCVLATGDINHIYSKYLCTNVIAYQSAASLSPRIVLSTFVPARRKILITCKRCQNLTTQCTNVHAA